MAKVQINKGLRWWVLIIAIINPVFSYITNATGITGKTIAEVSMQYDNYFMPASYAFSIWGLIYLSFILYAIYQLLPRQQYDRFYDKLSVPFITANIAGMVWQIVFSYELLTTGTFIIVAMLVIAGGMFAIVKNELKSERYSGWIAAPFSLYLGWLSVANIANAAAWLTAQGWDGGPLTEQQWAAIMIFTAAALGIIISLFYKDWIYPLVIVWACVAIYVANRYLNNAVATDALLASVVVSIYVVSFFIWQYLHDVHEVHGKWLRKHHHNNVLRH